jgi:hypothetical protein
MRAPDSFAVLMARRWSDDARPCLIWSRGSPARPAAVAAPMSGRITTGNAETNQKRTARCSRVVAQSRCEFRCVV